MGDGLGAHLDNAQSPQPCLAHSPGSTTVAATGGGYMPQDPGPQPPLWGTHTPKNLFQRCHLWWPRSHAWTDSLFPICNLLCLPPLTHSRACRPAMPVCLGHPIPIITSALLVPMACRGYGSTHPKVTSLCPRDTCPFTDGSAKF
jgi:hypothetical protein